MPKARSKSLSPAEIAAAIERGRALKEKFFDLAHKAYRRHPRKTEEIRQAYFRGEISLERALRELEKLARS